MGRETIDVVGARTNNLRDVSVSIPKGRLVAFTGVSGSGKTSLAIDTLHNEAQLRYLERPCGPAGRWRIGSGVVLKLLAAGRPGRDRPTSESRHRYVRPLFARSPDLHPSLLGDRLCSNRAGQVRVGQVRAVGQGGFGEAFIIWSRPDARGSHLRLCRVDEVWKADVIGAKAPASRSGTVTQALSVGPTWGSRWCWPCGWRDVRWWLGGEAGLLVCA